MLRLSRAQVREVDRIAIEGYGIPGIVLMENAARSAVEAIELRFGPLSGKRIYIACGPGNNGGDGLAMARLLAIRGAAVQVFVLAEQEPTGDARINYDIVFGMMLNACWQIANTGVDQPLETIAADLLVDALFGTGLRREPVGEFAELIQTLNESRIPIIAIDLPSGLDCDTGEPLGDACVKADLTVTFVVEKLGFVNPKSKPYTGEVVVGDIGCPREIIDRVLREIPHPS